MADGSDRPFVIESPTRVRLGPQAREMARMQGMTERELAEHLLQQHKLRQSGVVQQDGEG